MINLRFLARSVVLPAVVSGLWLVEAHSAALAPHRAVYNVDLVESSERAGITGMQGRIVYEFRGSACDGYTTNFRFVSQIVARGTSSVTDQQTTTYESGDGKDFQFLTKTYVNDAADKDLKGSAQRQADGLLIQMDKPEEGEFDLEDAAFPTQHVLDLLERADAGERFYEKKIFDGSEDADRVLTTSVIIGKKKTAEADDETAVMGDLAKDDYRSISIAYFDEFEVEGEGEPVYRIAFKLHDNGVTRSLKMDYGDFILEGELEELEMLEATSCDQ